MVICEILFGGMHPIFISMMYMEIETFPVSVIAQNAMMVVCWTLFVLYTLMLLYLRLLKYSPLNSNSNKEGSVYLTTHSAHFIFDYMASDV